MKYIYVLYVAFMKKFKKMRLVVDHTNDETSERFCYKALNYADELAVLLAGKRKRAAETCRMAKKVNDEMSKTYGHRGTSESSFNAHSRQNYIASRRPTPAKAHRSVGHDSHFYRASS